MSPWSAGDGGRAAASMHRHAGQVQARAFVDDDRAHPSRSTWNAASPAVRLGLIGVRAAPSRQLANMATTSSTRLASSVATTSPGVDAAAAEGLGRGPDPGGELGVGERQAVVVDAGTIGVGSAARWSGRDARWAVRLGR